MHKEMTIVVYGWARHLLCSRYLQNIHSNVTVLQLNCMEASMLENACWQQFFSTTYTDGRSGMQTEILSNCLPFKYIL